VRAKQVPRGGNAYTGVKPTASLTVHVNASRLKPTAGLTGGARGRSFAPCLALVAIHSQQRGGLPTRARLRALLLRRALRLNITLTLLVSLFYADGI
jgi:hypothetical protein